MTTITLEVPDELAGRLAPLKNQLPYILAQTLDLLGLSPTKSTTSGKISPLLGEVLDFLASGPSPLAIVNFKVSPAAQARLEELLDQNREARLTLTERAELDTYQQIQQLLVLLKARARAALQQAT